MSHVTSGNPCTLPDPAKRMSSHRQSRLRNGWLVAAYDRHAQLKGNTLLHLIGMFRGCWSMNVFAPQSHLLELNTAFIKGQKEEIVQLERNRVWAVNGGGEAPICSSGHIYRENS